MRTFDRHVELVRQSRLELDVARLVADGGNVAVVAAGVEQAIAEPEIDFPGLEGFDRNVLDLLGSVG